MQAAEVLARHRSSCFHLDADDPASGILQDEIDFELIPIAARLDLLKIIEPGPFYEASRRLKHELDFHGFVRELDLPRFGSL